MYLATDRKGEQVDLISQLARRLEYLSQRDGGAAVLVERLGRDRQDAARGDVTGAGEAPRTGPIAARRKEHAGQAHSTVKAIRSIGCISRCRIHTGRLTPDQQEPCPSPAPSGARMWGALHTDAEGQSSATTHSWQRG